jgi:WD40 repeat protein
VNYDEAPLLELERGPSTPLLLVSGHRDGRLELVDAEPGGHSRPIGRHAAQVTRVDVSSDGTYILSVARDRTLKLWNDPTDAHVAGGGEPRRACRNRRTRGGELGSGIGTTLVKDPHTRTLALASGHGRYITVTPERTLVSVGEWPLHTV